MIYIYRKVNNYSGYEISTENKVLDTSAEKTGGKKKQNYKLLNVSRIEKKKAF